MFRNTPGVLPVQLVLFHVFRNTKFGQHQWTSVRPGLMAAAAPPLSGGESLELRAAKLRLREGAPDCLLCLTCCVEPTTRARARTHTRTHTHAHTHTHAARGLLASGYKLCHGKLRLDFENLFTVGDWEAAQGAVAHTHDLHQVRCKTACACVSTAVAAAPSSSHVAAAPLRARSREL